MGNLNGIQNAFISLQCYVKMPDPTEYHTVVKDSLGYGKKVRQPDIIKTEVIKVTHQTISLVCLEIHKWREAGNISENENIVSKHL